MDMPDISLKDGITATPPTTKQEDESCSDIEAQKPEALITRPTQLLDQPPHTILSEKKKILTIMIASCWILVIPFL